jgi:ABC-type glycerol-3-phosphate transport system substrate-binding protein
MAINTDILDRAGFPVPGDDWSMDDLLDMLEAIKQLPDYAGNSDDGSGIWPTFLYAKNNTADYFYLNYFSSFGAELFSDNDYTRSAVNDTPGGVEAFRFLKLLVERGYAPPDAATRGVNELLPGFREGRIAVTGYRPNWIPPHQKAAMDAGKLDEPFNYVVLPFPTAPGIEGPPPMPGIGTGAYATATDDPVKAKILTELVECVMSYQDVSATKGDIPTRLDIERVAPDPETERIFGVADTAGFMDPGYTFEWYMESRAALPPILRDLYTGQITPEEAAQNYEDAINAILAEYAE